MTAPHESIVILDYGSQYTRLIARRIREAKVYSVVVGPAASRAEIEALRPRGLILSGGPQSVYAPGSPKPSFDLTDMGLPILGVCYGMDVLAQSLGGEVSRAPGREYGRAEFAPSPRSPLFAGLSEKETVWMSHGDLVSSAPPGFAVSGSTDSAPIASFEDPARRIFAIQFHPEVRHTENGALVIENFLFPICGAKPDWTMSSFREEKIAEIRRRAPGGKVLCALSGGVDSSVTAVLLREAIGDRVLPIFVDHGLLRKKERERVAAAFERFGLSIDVVDASAFFFERLRGVTDPERKRKTIGAAFIEVFEREAKKFSDVRYLAQGTLYPDVIESVSLKGPSSVIKSHHNVGGLPEKLGLELIEPVRELFKDEVRALGAELGLPKQFLSRHPFPGPGLAVRILGEVTPDRCAILQEADEILIDEIRSAGLYDAISQAFAVLLPVKSVGVMGDERTYENVLAIRCVQTSDFMTADWFRLPHDVLDSIASRIVGSVRGINRVVYDVTSKPPGTIEWE